MSDPLEEANFNIFQYVLASDDDVPPDNPTTEISAKSNPEVDNAAGHETMDQENTGKPSDPVISDEMGNVFASSIMLTPEMLMRPETVDTAPVEQEPLFGRRRQRKEPHVPRGVSAESSHLILPMPIQFEIAGHSSGGAGKKRSAESKSSSKPKKPKEKLTNDAEKKEKERNASREARIRAKERLEAFVQEIEFLKCQLQVKVNEIDILKDKLEAEYAKNLTNNELRQSLHYLNAAVLALQGGLDEAQDTAGIESAQAAVAQLDPDVQDQADQS